MVVSEQVAISAPPITLAVAAELTVSASLPLPLRRAIAQALTLENPLYREAEAHGRGTWDIEPELYYWRGVADGSLIVPRGVGRVVRALCEEYGVPYRVMDATQAAPPVAFEERITLSAAQERAVSDMLTRRIGVLEAPAGAGKTIMGLAMVARRQQPALWIVHTKELAKQAIARAVAVLGLDEAEIGLVGDGQCTVGERLTVALVQTLARGIPPALLGVGHVLVDECHHTPAAQLSSVVSQFPAKYLTGMSATVYRRDGLDRVIHWYLGETVARIDRLDLADRLIAPRVIKRDTGIAPSGESFTEIVTDLIGHGRRNALIAADVAQAVATGRSCLVLSERVEHVKELTRLLREQGIAVASLYGSMGKKARGQVVEDLRSGALTVAVATGSLVGEGFDCPALSALFIATPVSFSGRVTQFIGRVSRTAPGKDSALVVDFCDDHPMLWASWRNRRQVYTAQGLTIQARRAA